LDIKRTLISAGEEVADAFDAITSGTSKLVNKAVDKYVCIGVTGSIRGEATKKVDKIKELLSAGQSVASIVKETKFSKASVYNLIKENSLVVLKST